ncbi:PilZ domain-containing protein [Desulfovibrio mangrovi]|uniref:PilZ domain-containing protein n=1 Tax=Desulfovibrio mangrovi TaxID=2976983 RepID=UPI0022464128|nr:PilZ domain-containing protein [Desulfovibrio mangrovi]UZP68506.1 PilZ domain-containing protein [Desulfovibrio mangrovi]
MEQRAYSRIRLFMKGRVRLLATESESPRFTGFSLPEAPVDGKTLANAHIPEALVSFLLDMDAKLNAVLAHLKQDRLQDDFPLWTEIYELSGAGIRCLDTGDLNVGDHVEIILFLSEFPLRVAGAMGRVLRKEQGNDGRPQCAIEFYRIHEDDLEKVVQHVFVEERRRIRTMRLEEN